MSDCRDPAIKLFGRTIPLSDGGVVDPATDEMDIYNGVSNKKVEALMPESIEAWDQNEPVNSNGLSNSNEDDRQTSTDEAKVRGDVQLEQDRAQANIDTSNQDKVLKKPDKILPCPRCKSMDTKFCYFNNYNVNQPRHFCKNCQRYWTAGGTMRNVPVGAGKRKNKISASHHRHIMTMPDGKPCARLDVPDLACEEAISCGSSAPMRSSKENEAVLKFCPEAPLCESMSSVINITEQKKNIEKNPCEESMNAAAHASSVAASLHVEDDGTEITVQNGESTTQVCHNGPSPMHHLSFYPGYPFVFPWSPGYSNASAMAVGRCSSDLFNGVGNGSSNTVPWNSPPILAAPAFCSPAMAFPYMPASFWGCMPSWPTGTWNVPWMPSKEHLSSSLPTCNTGSARNGCPNLGKHSRDASLEGEEERQTRSLWVPKTLRIDDPEEAAKSSIWATLGIKLDEPTKKGGVLNAFQSKTKAKEQTTDANQVLRANPAAMCRSQTFQESTT